MDLDKILPYVVPLLTALGVYLAAWLQFSGQVAKVKADAAAAHAQLLAEAEAAAREGKRDDFKANLEAFRERAEAAERRADELAKEFAEYKGASSQRMDSLERENKEMRRENEEFRREMDAMILKICPWGRVDCPRERTPVTVVAGRKG